MLTQKDIKAHYKNTVVKQTIQRICIDEETGSRRAGNLDFSKWYKVTNNKKIKYDLTNKVDYINMSKDGRTLYWTLNLFNPDIFQIDYNEVQPGQGPQISREYTTGYTFGIDIDKEHGKDIHEPAVKASVEAIAQFFVNKLRQYVPNSVYVLYSGGGIYILVHHKCFSSYYTQHISDWTQAIRTLEDAFDFLIADMRDEFFTLYPEHRGNVKPDQLNNAQRVFKTIFSVHKSLDYAVIPLNPENIQIDFAKAALPLQSDVLKTGESWYTTYDEGSALLEGLLKPCLEKAAKLNTKNVNYNKPYSKSATPLEDINAWAPCMRNIYLLPACGEGATRALAAFASFLGQIGIEREEAADMFIELANRWSARPSNIFDSYYGKMRVPSCDKLTSNTNLGFPKGVSVRSLNVCKPDTRCLKVSDPVYYTDTTANSKKLLGRLGKSEEATQLESQAAVPTQPTPEKATEAPKLAKPVEVKTVNKEVSAPSLTKKPATPAELEAMHQAVLLYGNTLKTAELSLNTFVYNFLKVYSQFKNNRDYIVNLVENLEKKGKIRKFHETELSEIEAKKIKELREAETRKVKELNEAKARDVKAVTAGLLAGKKFEIDYLNGCLCEVLTEETVRDSFTGELTNITLTSGDFTCVKATDVPDFLAKHLLCDDDVYAILVRGDYTLIEQEAVKAAYLRNHDKGSLDKLLKEVESTLKENLENDVAELFTGALQKPKSAAEKAIAAFFKDAHTDISGVIATNAIEAKEALGIKR